MTAAHVIAPLEDGTVVLVQRLQAAASVLLPEPETIEVTATDAGSSLLVRLVEAVQRDCSPERLWLLYTAVASAFPIEDELLEGLRFFELSSESESTIWLLDSCYHASAARGAPELTMEVARNRVIVDVDFSAQHELNTGIQRVARQTMPRWSLNKDVILAAWTAGEGALRELVDKEKDRILRWDARVAATAPLYSPGTPRRPVAIDCGAAGGRCAENLSATRRTRSVLRQRRRDRRARHDSGSERRPHAAR